MGARACAWLQSLRHSRRVCAGALDRRPSVANVRAVTAASIVAELRALLGRHNPLEEGPAGLYAACDALAGDEAPAIVERMRGQPAVPLAKYYDGPSHRSR
jgi:hypothetical protein